MFTMVKFKTIMNTVHPHVFNCKLFIFQSHSSKLWEVIMV